MESVIQFVPNILICFTEVLIVLGLKYVFCLSTFTPKRISTPTLFLRSNHVTSWLKPYPVKAEINLNDYYILVSNWLFHNLK